MNVDRLYNEHVMLYEALNESFIGWLEENFKSTNHMDLKKLDDTLVSKIKTQADKDKALKECDNISKNTDLNVGNRIKAVFVGGIVALMMRDFNKDDHVKFKSSLLKLRSRIESIKVSKE